MKFCVKLIIILFIVLNYLRLKYEIEKENKLMKQKVIMLIFNNMTRHVSKYPFRGYFSLSHVLLHFADMEKCWKAICSLYFCSNYPYFCI